MKTPVAALVLATSMLVAQPFIGFASAWAASPKKDDGHGKADAHAKPEPPKEKIERIEHAETFFRNTKADIRNGGNRAYYACDADYVQMPPLEAFRNAESHAATLAHELTHWTRHPSRLNREFGRKRWGDEGYAMEELVAELGAAFLTAELGIDSDRVQHPNYLANWLTALKADAKYIFSVASLSKMACDFLKEKSQP